MNVIDILNALGEYPFDTEVGVKLEGQDNFLDNLAIADIVPADDMHDKCILVLEENEPIRDSELENRSCVECTEKEIDPTRKTDPAGPVRLTMIQDEDGQWWCKECFQMRTVRRLYTAIREHIVKDQRLDVAREIFRAIYRTEPPVWDDDSTLIEVDENISESDWAS